MQDTIDIRKVTINDLSDIVSLEQKCFIGKSAYSTNQLKYLITQANSNCLIKKLNSKIQGYIIVLYRNKTSVAGIETLNVDPNYRGQGVGKQLLFAAEKDMTYRGIRKIRLEVTTGNNAAISLYNKSGFRVISILKNYYQNEQHGTRDAYRMIKQLTT